MNSIANLNTVVDFNELYPVTFLKIYKQYKNDKNKMQVYIKEKVNQYNKNLNDTLKEILRFN